MEDLVGTLLDNTYRIEKLLGQGGMGAVFQAQDITLNRQVAIKVMHPHIAQQRGFRERFLQEARAIAALDHPGIVQIYSFSRNPELLYIAMAFIQGQNLADWLHLLSERDMVISLPESLAIVERVSNALAYAHRRGVYHRDIKPGNIILRPLDRGHDADTGLGFQPIVTDFGLAKLAEGGIMSMPGMSMGTPAYMAPEQCQGQEIDGRADIYALGVVLYELVTGRVPFEVRTLTEAIRAHTQESPPPPRSIDSTIPSQVERVILKAMARRPEDRYQTADEMEQAAQLLRENLDRSGEATLTATQAGRASLVTMMGQEAPPPTPDSDLWPTPPSQLVPGGQVVIMLPDGTTRAVAFGASKKLTIGRDAENDITLVDNMVSRQHAQITVSEGRYYVTDLNSTNGTWIGNDKLLPGVSEVWRPEQSLRVGNHYLRLQAPAEAGAEPSRPVATYAPQASAEAQVPIQITLEPPQLRVRPGTPVIMTVRVLNRQQQVDHLAPEVEGIPAEWVTLPEQTLRLAPGDTGSLTLRFLPPRTASSHAGQHELTVHVRSLSTPTHSVSASATLTIEPFRDLRLALTPRTITNAGRGQVTLTNSGNAPESVVLTVEDPDEAIQPPEASPPVTVPPGDTQDMGLSLEMRGKRPLMGNIESHAFAVAALSGGERVADTQGTFRVRPYLPVWAIPLFTTLALLLCAASVFVYSNIQRDRAATATADHLVMVGQTQTLEAMSALEQTQVAEAQATEQAQALALQMTAEAEATGTQVAIEGEAAATRAAAEAEAAETQAALDAAATATAQFTPEAPPTATATATEMPTATPTPTPFFGPGAAKGFTIEGIDVGDLNQVCVQHDNSGHNPGWFVDQILVDSGTGYIPFALNRWIAVDQGDGSLLACTALPTPTPAATATPAPTVPAGGGFFFPIPTLILFPTPTPTLNWGLILPPILLVTPEIVIPQITLPPAVSAKMYNILIVTGDMPDAGTSAVISIQLQGSDGTTAWMVLNE